MKKVIFVLLIFIAAVFSPVTPQAKTPSDNLAFSIKIDNNLEPISAEKILADLEKELKRKGYKGNIRQIPWLSDDVREGESLVLLNLIDCHWETRKAFSIPYILNRYSRVYTMACFVELPGGKKGKVAKFIKVDGSIGKQAQIMQNDRYDPDLLLDQTQKVKLEGEVCWKLVKKITGLLSKNLN